MKNKTLIAYASKHGSTAEIAERIKEILLGKNLAADLLPVEEVKELTSYDYIIVGSAVYIGQWQKKAAKFLKENKDLLTKKKVWFFSTGPTGEGNPEELMKGWKFPESLQSTADLIKPVEIKLFGGALVESKLNTLEKMTIKMVKAPMGDFRDWEDVEYWAHDIARVIMKSD